MKVSHRYNQNFALIKVVMVDDGVGKFRDQAASVTFTQLLIIEGNCIIKLSLG